MTLWALADYQTDLGAGHFMRTTAQVDDNWLCTANTTVESVVWFGGFHGSVIMQVVAPDGLIVGVSPKFGPWGVDGRMIGRSKRTELWHWQLERNADWSRVYGVPGARIVPYHFWDPQWPLVKLLIQVGRQFLK
ncbi:hypothetical protein ACWGE0_11880 [Lentzea sp. NPDC054927]